MSITVRIPGSLKDWFNGKTEISCTGNTILECLENINGLYPGLKNRLFDDNGGLHRIMIFLNGDHIRQLDGPGTLTEDDDEISIIPLAAGG
jgi:molybdopterin converting factor small subunit